VINDRLVLYSLSTRRDWSCSSFRLRFYHLACLRFSVELFLFVIFSTFFFVLVQLFFIYRLSSRSLRNHYFTLSLFIDDHDAMIVRWSSTRKKKLLKRKTSIKLCCVTCASLNRKRVKVAKILRAEIEFRTKKRELDVIFKRFEIRFICLDVYDLFCRSSSKWNDVVFIEKNEKWLWKNEIWILELIWRRRRDWQNELIERQRREFRRRRFLELTEHSRRDDSKDRVLELIEKLRRDRRKDKKMNRCESMRRRWKKEWKRKEL
jgi:hypothetical protein